MLPCSPSFFLSAPTNLDLCQLLSVDYLVFILHTHYLIWYCPASSTKVRPKRVGVFSYISFCYILLYFWLLSPSHCVWPHVSPAQVLTQSCRINGSRFILYLLKLFTSICSMKIWTISSKWERAGSHIGKPCLSLSCLLYLHNPAQPLSSPGCPGVSWSVLPKVSHAWLALYIFIISLSSWSAGTLAGLYLA